MLFCKFTFANNSVYKRQTINSNIQMTERELIKLEATIRKKMEEIKNQKVSLKDSGVGSLMNMLKKTDEAAYEKIMPQYKEMMKYNIFK
jgi:DNA-directed RNA polymerase alpha subunit